MLHVQLYTKDPCPLCDDVKLLLDALQETYPHQLEEIDITQDHDLNMHYRFLIPVLQIGDRQIKAPIGMADLNRFLREAS
ncbi:MAG: glutaredoxin family protein [Chloroflexota bacterium]